MDQSKQIEELRICLSKAVVMLNDTYDKIEPSEQEKDDFVILTEVVKKYETATADETQPQ